MSMTNRGTRTRLLGSVGTAVLGALIASGAQAAETQIQAGTPSVSATAGLSINSPLTNGGSVTASVSEADGKINQEGVQQDADAGSSNTVSDNAITSRAIGNSNQASIPALEAIAADGAAILNTSVNTGVVSSGVEVSRLAIELEDFQNGSAANSGNTISADTTLNSASSSISGAVPLGFSSGTGGQSTANYPGGAGTQLDADGAVVVSSAQQAIASGQGAGSNASVSNNEVSLQLTSTDDNTVVSGPTLDNNTISATFRGNAARNTAEIQADPENKLNPQFAGAAVVTNLQVNTAEPTSLPDNVAALNEGSHIRGAVGSTTAVNTLQGSLSVAGNSITSAATGNEAVGAAAGVAGNRILLGDGMSITGAGSPGSGANIAYDNGSLTSTVAGDLVVHNSQGNVGLGGADQALNSLTDDASIAADVQDLDGGSVNLAANRIASSATGNNASSAIATGDNTATFSASVAMANQQVNDDASVSATTNDTGILANVGALDNSSVSVRKNTSAAEAYGNQVSQNIALAANSVTLGATETILAGGTGPDGHISASGAATVSNLQSRYGGDVTASNLGSAIAATVDGPVDSSVAVDQNRQEAVAVGSSATNGLSLASGAATGSGAGVANVQIGSDDSEVAARLEASANVLVYGDNTSGSVDLTDNLQRAIGYGNSAANTLAVAGNSADVPATTGPNAVGSVVTFDPNAANDGLVFDNLVSAQPTVRAAYGLLSDQSIKSDVSASAEGDLYVNVVGNVTEASSVTNGRNALVAAAYGNDVANAASLTPGQIEVGVASGFAAVANATNVQAVGGDAQVSAGVAPGNVVAVTIGADVDGSSVTASDNAIQALAYGSRATGNTLTVSGTNINTAPLASDDARGGATVARSAAQQLVTNASFSVQNAQAGQGSVLASQVAGGQITGTAAQIRIQIGDDVNGSSVAADNNVSTAAATSNSAVNGLSLSGNTLQTTSAVQNFQATDANVSALIGVKGVPADPGDTFEYTYQLILGGSCVDVTCTGVSGTDRILKEDLEPDQVSYLLANGWSDGWNSDPDYISRATSQTVPTELSVEQYNTLNSTPYNDEATIGAETGRPNLGGVTLAVGDAVSGSQLSVSGNRTAGSVTGNNAANSLTVAATNADNGSGRDVSRAGLVTVDLDDNPIIGAQADNALANVQEANGNSLSSTVYGTFAIDTAANATISGSSLSVSDNSQSATSVANTAVNTLKVGGQDTSGVTAGSALASDQSAATSVTASSDVELFAPAAVSQSTVNLTDNSNTALGVLNDVTNALSIQAANVTPVSVTSSVSLTVDGDLAAAAGDHVLANRQDADTNVTSTAATRLYNEDRVGATSGLDKSSLTIGDNTTVAEASANRALNTLSIKGGAAQAANAGIANVQSSSAGVTANATTSATLTLTGAGTPVSPALNASSAAISGNSTTALARGNAATNVLNATAGSSYGPATATVNSVVAGVPSVQAAAGVLNDQLNQGAVRAESVGASYSVALNAAPGNPAVSNSSVRINGNQVAAQAYGNTATNAVNVSALNTGAPTAAIGNYQYNTGAIVATATTVSFGATGAGRVAGSSLGVTGNQISAAAVGNSAVSTITAAR